MNSVYRFYSATDELLYIGMSINPFARYLHHVSKKDMSLVRVVEVEWFDTEQKAREAEAVAIRREKPLWNISGSKSQRKLRKTDMRPIPKPPQPVRVVKQPNHDFYHYSIGRVDGVLAPCQFDPGKAAELLNLLRAGDFLHVAQGVMVDPELIAEMQACGVHIVGLTR